MRAADVEALVGVPYCEKTCDCADFVVLVQQQLFGRAVRLPGARPRGAAGQAAIGDLSRPYATAAASPMDGDLVLMIEHGQKRAGHAGVFFRLAHEGWVLHSNEKNGCSVLHRVRDLPDFGLRIEGYYRWV
ncbi:peptidoglycan endopeptidase [Stenotrophomonas sp. C3(2023)]|uniref:peptidoglycan endopeptidase n=1 Tax=Stenotrophomonas sp. C3(2023) TaxID=3080277 RepID=UPI00293C30B2|nr:peptidoglycan endopeptidase [Stenotrophomonas sp. C3(2023)]MDV3469001.1 peptidoglycan endopeptidase [Stenotrophomonas sp. C3(2023)]